VWFARELARLLLKVGMGLIVALALATLWAVVGEHSFVHDLRITCSTLGGVALVMGAIGRGSNFERRMDYGVTEQYWGRVPGLSTLQRRGEDPTLAPGAVFFLTRVALLCFGFFVL
jgi:hypothetical protein